MNLTTQEENRWNIIYLFDKGIMTRHNLTSSELHKALAEIETMLTSGQIKATTFAITEEAEEAKQQ